MPGTLLAWLRRMSDIVCRVDKRDMGERLREVADQALSAGVVFLREQADVVAQADQPLEQALRVRGAVRSGHRRRRARSYTEGRRLRRAAGRPRCAAVSYRSTNPPRRSFRSIASTVPSTRGSSGGKKPTCGISSALASNRSLSYVWANAAKLRVERPPADLLVDLRADPAPAVDRAVESERLDGLDGPVERDPRHHLRIGEVMASAAHLPNAFVGSYATRSRDARAAHAETPRPPRGPGDRRAAHDGAHPSLRRRHRAGAGRRRHCRCARVSSSRTRRATAPRARPAIVRRRPRT